MILITSQCERKNNRKWWTKPFDTKVDEIAHRKVPHVKKRIGNKSIDRRRSFADDEHGEKFLLDESVIDKFKIVFGKLLVKCSNVAMVYEAMHWKRNDLLN